MLQYINKQYDWSKFQAESVSQGSLATILRDYSPALTQADSTQKACCPNEVPIKYVSLTEDAMQLHRPQSSSLSCKTGPHELPCCFLIKNAPRKQWPHCVENTVSTILQSSNNICLESYTDFPHAPQAPCLKRQSKRNEVGSIDRWVLMRDTMRGPAQTGNRSSPDSAQQQPMSFRYYKRHTALM